MRVCRDQSVERRSSGAPSALAGSAFASDFTGSSLALSTGGVWTRDEPSARASAYRVASSRRRNDRGRATERAISICDAPW